MTIDQIIDELGGARAVAERIGLSNHAVYKWGYRGKIPARSQRDLVRAYPDDNIRGMIDQLSPS